MRLKQTYGLLLSLGLLASSSALLAGCSPSNSVSQTPQQSMPAGDMPMEDHAMMMDLGPKDDEFDLRFVDGMILHHQGAIAMSEAALESSQRPEVKELAQNIIRAQEGEIAQMQSWRQEWYPQADADPIMYDAQMGHTMKMSAEMQSSMRMDGDLGRADDEFDLRFINGMIPHHDGALVMAKEGLENSDRPEIQQVSNDILRTQQVEIDLMNQWKKDWYGQ
ncbi:MAG: DUF305 domain-containing protein [Phormidesmis sp.]